MSEYKYKEPWSGVGGGMFIPGRCPARRQMRFREWFWWKLLGRRRGFDPHEELRCEHYEGHEQWPDSNPGQYNHLTPDGTEWSPVIGNGDTA